MGKRKSKLEEYAPLAKAAETILTEHVQSDDLRGDKVLLLMGLGLPFSVAANLSGFSESVCKKGPSHWRNPENIQARRLKLRSILPELYRDFAKASLGEIAAIKAKVLKELKDDPSKLTPTTYRIIRDIEKVAGVLEDYPSQQWNILGDPHFINQVQAYVRDIDEETKRRGGVKEAIMEEKSPNTESQEDQRKSKS